MLRRVSIILRVLWERKGRFELGELVGIILIGKKSLEDILGRIRRLFFFS